MASTRTLVTPNVTHRRSPVLLLLLRLMSRLPLAVHPRARARGWPRSFAVATGRAPARGQSAGGRPLQPARLGAASAEAGTQVLELPWIWCRPEPRATARRSRRSRGRARPRTPPAPGLGRSVPDAASGLFRNQCQGLRDACADHPVLTSSTAPRATCIEVLWRTARSRPQSEGRAGRHWRRAAAASRAAPRAGDRYPARPGADAGEGTWAPFFGRLAFTMTLPARLVERPAPGCSSWHTCRRPRPRLDVEP